MDDHHITVRKAVDQDWPHIWRILGPIIAAGETYSIPRRATEEQAKEYWMQRDSTIFVAELNSRVCGTYFLRTNQQGGGSHVCNCGYATAEDSQGRGVATAMCSHSLATARRIGYRAMQFNFVVSANARAVDLWKRMGFDVVGTLPGAFNHPTQGFVDVYVMYKELD